MPYLEVTKSETEEEQMATQVEMPELTGLTLKEAKSILKEWGLEYEIDTDDLESVITNQVPKKGITINEGTKVILYCN